MRSTALSASWRSLPTSWIVSISYTPSSNISTKSASRGMKCLSRSSNRSTPMTAVVFPSKNPLSSGSNEDMTDSTV